MAYLEMRGITKAFPGVVANNNVDFTVEDCSIHGLVGENGAGKSTLMRILYGMYTPDKGSILLDGQEVAIRNPRTAIGLGIGMVHQEFQLVPSLTVAENIVLGQEPRSGMWVQRNTMRSQVRELSERFGLHVDPDVRVAELPVGIRQRVEILKLLYREARLLILDEPTAVLTPQETAALLDVLHRLREEGHTIVFITHKLREVKAACQTATVLRRGEVAGVVDVERSSEAEIAALMVGGMLKEVGARRASEPGPARLIAQDLEVYSDRRVKALAGVSFSVHRGEIVGVAGVEGNGQSELVEALVGLRRAHGRIEVEGRDTARQTVRQRRASGLAVVPADRKNQGLNLLGDVGENLVANDYYHLPFSRFGFLNVEYVMRFSGEQMRRFDVRASGPRTKVSTLSGGNAQRVVIARELASRPPVLVASYPTRGLDLAAAHFVREQLAEMRDAGTAVLLISADLDELLAVASRILVLFEGQIAAEVAPGEVTLEQLGLFMAGKSDLDATNEPEART